MSTFTRITGTLACLAGLLSATASVWASEYSETWGPDVGSQLPVLEAPDQTGQVRTLDDLTGEQGLLLFLVRSADW